MTQAMSTTMDNPACEWVRGRLPLWTGFGDGADDPSDDGGDLGVEDRRSIGRHLKGCPGCREHRSALSRSMEALDRRVGLVADRSGCAVIVGLAGAADRGPSIRTPARRRNRPGSRPPAGNWRLASLDGERPLQSAWMQDTLRELLDAAGLGALGDRSGSAGRGPSMRSPRAATGRWRIAGASLAASVLALLVVLPASWRQRAGAEARIRENAAPVAAMVELPAGAPTRGAAGRRVRPRRRSGHRRGPVGAGRADPSPGRADACGRRHGGHQALGAEAVRLRPRAWDAHAARGSRCQAGVLDAVGSRSWAAGSKEDGSGLRCLPLAEVVAYDRLPNPLLPTAICLSTPLITGTRAVGRLAWLVAPC